MIHYLFKSTKKLYQRIYPNDGDLDWLVIGYLSASFSFLTVALLTIFSVQDGFSLPVGILIYIAYGVAISLIVPEEERKLGADYSVVPPILFLIMSIIIFAISES